MANASGLDKHSTSNSENPTVNRSDSVNLQPSIELSPLRDLEQFRKRRKVDSIGSNRQSRRNIRIASDEDDQMTSQPLRSGRDLEHNVTEQVSPIEIESEEDSHDFAMDQAVVPSRRDPVRSATAPKEVPSKNSRISSTIQDQKLPVHRANCLETDLSLEYPESDQESIRFQGEAARVHASDKGIFSTTKTSGKHVQSPIGLARSPYSVQNEFIQRQMRIRQPASDPFELSEEEMQPLVLSPVMPHLKRIPKLPLKQHNIVDFTVHGYGPLNQDLKSSSILQLSDEGLRFFDKSRDRVEDKHAFLDYNIIRNWSWVEEVNTISVLLNKVNPKMSSKEIYISLTRDESSRMIRELQKDLKDVPKVMHRYDPNPSAERVKACRESHSRLVERMQPESRRKRSPHKTDELLLGTCKKEAEPILRTVAPEELYQYSQSDGQETTKICQDIYQSGILRKSPTSIPLPTGRNQRSRPGDERNLLVDDSTTEKVTKLVHSTRESLPSPDHLKSKPRTRSADKKADPVHSIDTRIKEALLVYPNIKGQNSVTLYNDDLDRLKPNEFLNDSIVEFYLRYNYDQMDAETRDNAHIFNTFFYHRLTQKRERGEPNSGYESVRKWTSKGKGVDLFSKRLVVIPINENLHWYLAVIVNLDKVVFGDDVKRKQEASFIRQIDSIEESGAGQESAKTSKLLSTENLLAELEDHESDDDKTATDQSGSGPKSKSPRINWSGKHNTYNASARRILKTPSRSLLGSAEAAIEVTEPGEVASQPAAVQDSLSLSEKISLEERQRLLANHVRTTQDSETTTLENLTIESSEDDGIKAATYSKKTKGKKPTKLFSKGGTHISEDVPTIIILDSLGSSHPSVHKKLKSYLVAEAKDKKDQILDASQFATCKADVPSQDNFSDCGLFLIQYADTLLRQPEIVKYLLNRVEFDSVESQQAHKKWFKNLFQIDRIPRRRAEMIQQILQLSEPYRQHAAAEKERRKLEKRAAKLLVEAGGRDETRTDQHDLDSSGSVVVEKTENIPISTKVIPAMSGLEKSGVDAVQEPSSLDHSVDHKSRHINTETFQKRLDRGDPHEDSIDPIDML